jgi:ribosome assembly protein 3
VEDVPRDVGEDVGAAKKEKSGKSKSPPTPADEDVSMADSTPTFISPDPQPQPAPASAPPTKKPKSSKPSTSGTPSSAPAKKPQSQTQEDFGAIYLRRIAAELADDLDKVREAPDFKANSVPMLVHALRQGESMFSVEERRRVVGAAGN